MLRRLFGPFPGPLLVFLLYWIACPPKAASTGCLKLSLSASSLPHLPFQLPAGMHVTSPFCLGKSGCGNTAVGTLPCSTNAFGIIAIIASQAPFSPSIFLPLSPYFPVPLCSLHIPLSYKFIHCFFPSYLQGAINSRFSPTQLAHLLLYHAVPPISNMPPPSHSNIHSCLSTLAASHATLLSPRCCILQARWQT
ncbi:hypothetical protein LI328DRAFT_125021 [Trichoderma asperelloides]|nr:hypothetical protein LI328DRAFT_125021 [Trichoderma asperelloides]